MPSDHFIKKTHILKKSIENLEFDQINNNWVLLGIKPTHPATSYGYIITKSNSEKQNKELMHIKSFSEKPNLKKAKQLISQNNAYWNSGIFLVSAKHALNSINYYNDKIAKSCEKVFKNQNLIKNLMK